jgi:predicted ATPase/DNA-binding CsgD family transcriptional regulator
MPRQGELRTVPDVATPLVGRRREVGRILELLSDPETRLLTLVGPGGVGKTRLATEVAVRVSGDDFPDGVVFVELAAVGDADLMVATIAGSLGLAVDGPRTPSDSLREYLRDRDLLLILDNFEHLLKQDHAARFVGSLVAAGDGRLAILATSRERLRLRGERTFDVQPFALSPPLATASSDVEDADAIKLFEQNARSVMPDFKVTEANEPTILEVCRRVDGLPLGIELAAARIAHFSVEELLSRMERRLPLLTIGPRDAPDRLRTMRQAIAWSYDMLSAAEKMCFRTVSVFAGAFSAEMANAVFDRRDVRDQATLDVFAATGDQSEPFVDLLASLIDQSLLRRINRPSDQTRLAMLDTIREFGLEQVSICGEEDSIRWAHVAAYLSMTEEVQPRLYGADSARWFDQLEQEHDNIRAAIAWALDHDGIESALRICTASWLFWKQRGHLSDAILWLRRGVDRAGASVTIQLANAYLLLGHSEADLTRSSEYYLTSLELYRQLGDSRSAAGALSSLGMDAFLRGDFVRARSLHKESLDIFRALGSERDVAHAHYQLGRAAAGDGDYKGARQHIEDARGIWEQIGDTGSAVYALLEIARVSLRQRRLSEADELLRWGYAKARDIGFEDASAAFLCLRGYVALQSGDASAAATHLQSALRVFVNLGQRNVEMAQAIEGIARLALVWRRFEEAVRLRSATSAWRQRTGNVLPVVEQAEMDRDIESLRGELGAERYEREWAAGMTDSNLDDAVVLACSIDIKAQPAHPAEDAKLRMAAIRTLTPQERRVLCCVVTGLSSQQIADLLSVRVRTVTTHLDRIFSKLDVDNRTAAAAQAIAIDLCGST